MISYKQTRELKPEEARDIYQRAGLQRPQDLKTIESMLQHANLLITAWDGESLVGFLRAMTDFTFDCYVNDLAVDVNYQGRGIGRELMQRLNAELEPQVLIVLVSASSAVQFYENIGFQLGSQPYGEMMCRAVQSAEQQVNSGREDEGQ